MRDIFPTYITECAVRTPEHPVHVRPQKPIHPVLVLYLSHCQNTKCGAKVQQIFDIYKILVHFFLFLACGVGGLPLRCPPSACGRLSCIVRHVVYYPECHSGLSDLSPRPIHAKCGCIPCGAYVHSGKLHPPYRAVYLRCFSSFCCLVGVLFSSVFRRVSPAGVPCAISMSAFLFLLLRPIPTYFL